MQTKIRGAKSVETAFRELLNTGNNPGTRCGAMDWVVLKTLLKVLITHWKREANREFMSMIIDEKR